MNPSRASGVELGTFLHHGSSGSPASLPIEAINRHLLVTGSPGSGKTTTVQTLLVKLWREHRIPFVVIEAVKTEYRNLLNISGLGDELTVISLGREDLLPLRLNPLQPPPGVRRETHASAVLQALRMAMPLQPPLPQLVESAIDHAYLAAGWDYDTTTEDGFDPPTLRSLVGSFSAVFSEAGYRGEAHNIGVAFEVRMRSLLTGSRGRALDTVESTDLAADLDRPLVIELDEFGSDEERALIAALVLTRVRAAARRRSGHGLRHVVVLEEAHRILPAHSPTVSAEGASLRADAVEEFVNGIAELRSAGEGFIISSQSPARLASASFEMAATRIIHSLAGDADRAAMLADVAADDEDAAMAARLARTEALVRWPPLEDPQLVAMRPAPGVDTEANVSDDEVHARMAAERAHVRTLLPFALCTRKVCTTGCDVMRRRSGAQIAATVRPQLDAATEGDFLQHVANAVERQSPADVPTAYCAVVHLHVQGNLRVPTSTNRAREQLIRQFEGE